MKKFALATVAAIVTVVSLSSAAEARRRHFDDNIDVVFIKKDRPHCKTMKFVEIGHHGRTKVTIVKKCR